MGFSCVIQIVTEIRSHLSDEHDAASDPPRRLLLFLIAVTSPPLPALPPRELQSGGYGVQSM
jgi:hypothetical protein